jgi:RNA polymerase sigma-70 factor (ECF subfamily)
MDGTVAQQADAFDQRAALAGMLPELRAFARLRAGSRSEADDLVQEALLRMLRASGGFRPGPDPAAGLRAWAFAVLRNTFHEAHRRRRREAGRVAASPAGQPGEGRPPTQEHEAGMGDLARALATLPPALREALVLVGARGLSYEEAAAICKVPIGTMKARVSRGRRVLAAALEDGPPPAPRRAAPLATL